MKTIGIIGGLGPASTVKYYEWLNEGVRLALGGAHSAKIILTSVDGETVKNFREAGDIKGEGAFFAKEAKKLEMSGADFIVIASNTSHKNAPYIEKEVSIPLLHLADITAQRIVSSGVNNIALLGTVYTMEQGFYKDRLADAGLNVVIPEKDDGAFISNSIYNELVKSVVKPETRAEYIRIIKALESDGIKGVILGCTELTLLGLDEDINVPVFDTTKIHVEEALDFMLL